MQLSRLHRLLFSPLPFHRQPAPERVPIILSAARNLLSHNAHYISAATTITIFARSGNEAAREWTSRHTCYLRYAETILQNLEPKKRHNRNGYDPKTFALDWIITGRGLPLQMLAEIAADPEAANTDEANVIIDQLGHHSNGWHPQFLNHLALVRHPENIATCAVLRPPPEKAAEYITIFFRLETALRNGEISVEQFEAENAAIGAGDHIPLIGYLYGGPTGGTIFDASKNYIGELIPGDHQLPLELCQS